MRFKSKIEAYSYCISQLTKLKNTINTPSLIMRYQGFILGLSETISQLKIAVDNHEQNVRIVISVLDILQKNSQCPANIREYLTGLQIDLLKSDYKQTQIEKFKNPLARRIESEIAISLLQKPTEAMMVSVKKISADLLQCIDFMGDKFYANLPSLTLSENIVAFGAFDKTPNIWQVKQILKSCDANDFAKIMYLHYRLGALIRQVPFFPKSNMREPVGKFKDIVLSLTPAWQDFFMKNIITGTEKPAHKNYRYYISNELIYDSPLYRAEKSRGRAGHINEILTNEMGLMLFEQREHAQGFPIHTSSPWVADCKAQAPDYSSQYVSELIDNDAVYVAGPSGMMSVLLNTMEILSNFETIPMKQNYVSATMAYIVSGGFHSIHEVIGPAEYALNLVPGYPIAPPKTGSTALPPQYHTFFMQQFQIDPEFQERYQTAWDRYLSYFDTIYAPQCTHRFTLELPTWPTEDRYTSPDSGICSSTPSPSSSSRAGTLYYSLFARMSIDANGKILQEPDESDDENKQSSYS